MRFNFRSTFFSSLIALAFAAGFNSFAQTSEVLNLAGSEWGPENGFDQFVQFKAEGELFGFGGCNSFIGNYTYEAGNLSIKNLILTEATCAGLTGVEAAFMEGLQNAHTVKMDGLLLKVYDKNDVWVLGLSRRDFD